MKRIYTLQPKFAILLAVLCIALAPVAMQLHAQTPEADAPPPAETAPPPPPAEDPPPPAEEPAPPAEEPPPPPPPAEEPAPPAEEPPPPPPAEEPAPPAEEPAPPPAEEPAPPAEEPPPAPAEEPAPPAEEPAPPPPAEEPDSGSATEEPGDVATEEPTTEATEEATTEATEEPTSEATEEPTTEESTPEATEEVEDEGTPTPTEEVIVPDELNLVSSSSVTINPGEHKDVVVRYTLGSDRVKTEMSANLTAPGGESLEGWSLVPMQGADLDEDPNDANRHLKARIDYADTVENGDVYETAWRVTAPDHIEEPVTVRLHLSTKIHRDDGVTDGVIKNDLVNFSSVASEHNPTLTCDEVVAEDVDNNWNCTFDTTHPDDDVVITASADIPEGWELALDDAGLTGEPVALNGNAVAANSFVLEATYPIGCPDVHTTFSSSLDLTLTYPSGEVSTLTTDMPLVFERPTPSLTVQNFEFDGINDMDSLISQGELVLSYADAPCAWQATIELSDLTSDEFVLDTLLFTVAAVESDVDASITMSDNLLNVLVPASDDGSGAGTITIELQLELPHPIPPGIYVVKVLTQFAWLDEI